MMMIIIIMMMMMITMMLMIMMMLMTNVASRGKGGTTVYINKEQRIRRNSASARIHFFIATQAHTHTNAIGSTGSPELKRATDRHTTYSTPRAAIACVAACQRTVIAPHTRTNSGNRDTNNTSSTSSSTSTASSRSSSTTNS